MRNVPVEITEDVIMADPVRSLASVAQIAMQRLDQAVQALERARTLAEA